MPKMPNYIVSTVRQLSRRFCDGIVQAALVNKIATSEAIIVAFDINIEVPPPTGLGMMLHSDKFKMKKSGCRKS